MIARKPEHFEELTLRGAVAYAVRCALRVHPLVNESKELSPADVKSAAHAIKVAKDFVCGDLLPSSVMTFLEALEARDSDAPGSAEGVAVLAAHYSAMAATSAIDSEAFLETYLSDISDSRAAAAVAVESATLIGKHSEDSERHALAREADYKKLCELTDGQEGLGDPIDLAALGPLWPDDG